MRICPPPDNTERRKWQDPESILAEIGLKPGFTFIDVGCGNGFFTLLAAKKVGIKGKVYGLDLNLQLIATLKKAADAEGLKNITLKTSKAEETVLCKQCADIVFFGIVMHDFEDATRVLKNAMKMLKPTGRLVNLDWKKEPMKLGPPLEIRFSEEKAQRLVKAAGFTMESVKDSGHYHYLIISRPHHGI